VHHRHVPYGDMSRTASAGGSGGTARQVVPWARAAALRYAPEGLRTKTYDTTRKPHLRLPRHLNHNIPPHLDQVVLDLHLCNNVMVEAPYHACTEGASPYCLALLHTANGREQPTLLQTYAGAPAHHLSAGGPSSVHLASGARKSAPCDTTVFGRA